MGDEARWGVLTPVRTDVPGPRTVADEDRAQAAARRTLRAQVARLEAELASATLTAFEMRLEGLGSTVVAAPGTPRLLNLGELERVRDDLATRVAERRREIAVGAARQARSRELLALVELEPGRHRFTRISARELGQPGCGVWHVAPRFGVVGMLMGWWQVKMSSGCPLPGGRGRRSPARP